jgi:hypothetical protein
VRATVSAFTRVFNALWRGRVEDAYGYDPRADGLKVRSLSIRV